MIDNHVYVVSAKRTAVGKIGGAVGELIKRIGCHAWRPGHIHFKIEAEGHKPLTTMLFIPMILGLIQM